MNVWLLCLAGLLALIVVFLALKVYFLRKSAREIGAEINRILDDDTNVLIQISSGDAAMRQLAEDINVELRRLRRLRRHFQQGDMALKEAVTNISHDLRTPLTAMKGYLDLLEQEEKSQRVARHLDVLQERTGTLIRLTDELFSYSVLTTADKALEYQEVDMGAALEESLAAYYGAFRTAGIAPEVSFPDQKIRRRLNRDALLRIFGNIIQNAVKYSDGDLKIALSEQGEVVFSNGAAQLNQVQVGKLFDRFYTVETARRSTGLGLSIAKNLTERMGGQIDAHYRDGRVSIRLSFPPYRPL